MGLREHLFLITTIMIVGCISDPSEMSFSPGPSVEDVGLDAVREDASAELDATRDVDPGGDVPVLPDASLPDVVSPDVVSPDVVSPDVVSPDASLPDADVVVDDDVADVTPPMYPASCAALLAAEPDSPDGLYTIYPAEEVAVEVTCDMTTDGGVGYTMFRIDDAEGLQGTQDAYRAPYPRSCPVHRPVQR
ncbi:MAG: fibrinogen-like YCDxxxxGGGW domain-containing protein [Bradymonadaceae bacterium]